MPDQQLGLLPPFMMLLLPLHDQGPIAASAAAATISLTMQLGLIDDVSQVGPHQARQVARQLQQVHIRRHRLATQLQAQDVVAPLCVWLGHADLQGQGAQGGVSGRLVSVLFQ